jgi:hypothetical protein
MSEETAVYNTNGNQSDVKQNPIPELPHPRVMAEMLMMATNRSMAGERQLLASRMGKSFGGDRNLYYTLGYKEELEFDDYLSFYNRGDIAEAIIEAPCNDTWRHAPTILEGMGEEAESGTEFTDSFDRMAKRIGLWNHMEQIDVVSGIGKFGILVIGVKDGKALDLPVERLTDIDQIIYLQAYSEGQVTINKLISDTSNEMYGMPESYKVEPGDGAQSFTVHYSRVIHIVERPRFSRVYGKPRLKAVFNRLMDLQKVIGSSAEAYWRLIYKGLILSSKEGHRLPTGADEVSELQDKVDDYVNDLRRFLILDGMELQDLGSQGVDPSNIVDVIITVIAATIRMPKRVLLGSELGELASSQDAGHWAGRIASRRTKHAEGRMLNPFVDRLIGWGVLDKVDYSWQWKPLFELSDMDKATAAKNYADALVSAVSAALGGGVDLAEFRERMTPFSVDPELMILDPFDATDTEDEDNPDDSNDETDDGDTA